MKQKNLIISKWVELSGLSDLWKMHSSIYERVIFKTFKGMNNLIPAYLSDLLIKYVTRRENLHSGNSSLYFTYQTCLVTVLELPPIFVSHLQSRVFKKSIKTHQYSVASHRETNNRLIGYSTCPLPKIANPVNANFPH